jgi:hypothetical protein
LIILGFFLCFVFSIATKIINFSNDICFDFRLNHEQNRRIDSFLKKKYIYPLVDWLIRLILTLTVSTTTTERAFSAMKIVKTRLRNRMEDDFLANYLIVYIVKEIAKRFTIDMIIDNFYYMKEQRAQLK